MIWLTWRQFRTQGAAALVALLAAGVGLAVTGAHLSDLYDASGIATCNGGCARVDAEFLAHFKVLRNLLGPALLVVPVVVGMFWGAPLLARELESGTYRLAWTQTITRARWLGVKVAVVGLAAAAVAGLCSLMVSWWLRPVDKVNMNRLIPGVFDERGVVALGYAAFAFGLAVAAGALIRRTVPAMATTLLAFVGVRLAMTFWVRPHLIAPAHTATALGAASNIGFEAGPPLGHLTFVASDPTIPGAWVYSSRIVDAVGRTPTAESLHNALHALCPTIGAPPGLGAAAPREVAPASHSSFDACVAQLSARFHLSVTYQPAGRYWTFQWYETAIFVALALIAVAVAFWSLRHRLR